MKISFCHLIMKKDVLAPPQSPSRLSSFQPPFSSEIVVVHNSDSESISDASCRSACRRRHMSVGASSSLLSSATAATTVITPKRGRKRPAIQRLSKDSNIDSSDEEYQTPLQHPRNDTVNSLTSPLRKSARIQERRLLVEKKKKKETEEGEDEGGRGREGNSKFVRREWKGRRGRSIPIKAILDKGYV